MLRRFAHALMFLAMFCIAGGHWALFQTVAWVEMTRTYSIQQGSLLAGLERTFSGKAPCSKCHRIQEQRQQEEKLPALVKVEKKAESLLPVTIVCPRTLLVVTQSYPWPQSLSYPARTAEPLSPVPIFLEA